MPDQGILPRSQERIARFSGLLGPLVIMFGMLVSALGYTGVEGQDYALRNHFVSELGQVGVSDLAWVFNASLVIGGSFNAVFLARLARGIPGWPRYPLLVLGLAAAVFGALVGVFPMNNLGPHIFAALGFFNLGMLVTFLYSLLLLFGRGGPLPRWLALPGLLNTAAFFWFNNFPSEVESGVDFQEGMEGLLTNRPDVIPLAALEWAVILGILAWFLILGIYLCFKKNWPTDRYGTIN